MNHFGAALKSSAPYYDPEGQVLDLKDAEGLCLKHVLTNIFGTCTPVHARAYKASCAAMGLKQVKIHDDIMLPRYPMCEREQFILIRGAVETLREAE